MNATSVRMRFLRNIDETTRVPGMASRGGEGETTSHAVREASSHAVRAASQSGVIRRGACHTAISFVKGARPRDPGG